VRAADHFFQSAARYGRVAVNTSLLKLSPSESRRAGLATLGWIEIMDEQNADWNDGRPGFFTPYEYAAMLSAAVDGHGGQMGPGMGLKTADPSMKLAMGGLAGTHAPAAEVWLTEFGSDTNGGPMTTYPIGDPSRQAPFHFTAWKVQGQWLLRSVLEISRAGLDVPSAASAIGGACISRAHQYMLADVFSNATGVYGTSGLTMSAQWQYAPKDSWWYFRAFLGWLGQYIFASVLTVPGAPATVRAYCHKRATDASTGGVARHAIVVWSTTAEAFVTPGVRIPVDTAACAVSAGGATVQVMTPTALFEYGVTAPAAVLAGGLVAVTVTELPVVLLSASAQPAPKGG
jgi:hypothetical protein